MIPDHLIQAIDKARRQGLSYDEVHAKFVKHGIDPEPALQHYASTLLPDGRPRGQVNLGDPHEHP